MFSSTVVVCRWSDLDIYLTSTADVYYCTGVRSTEYRVWYSVYEYEYSGFTVCSYKERLLMPEINGI